MARQFLTDLEVEAQRELRFKDADSSNYVGFKSPTAVTTNRIWTLPATDGTSGQMLSTNGTGTLNWATAAGATLVDGGNFNNGTSTVSTSATIDGGSFV